jgi:hypothetical protein
VTARADEPAPSLLGLAHVSSCSFLAARLSPSLQFWLALGGGVALARAAALHGMRAGYGASVAAVVQTVALIGPARVSGPLTQALNAPAMGRLQERGASRGVRLGAGLAIRLAHYAVVNVAFVVLVVGGLKEYVATYDRVAGFLRVLPQGTAAAVGLTVLFSVALGLFYTTVQLLIYERALDRWPTHPGPAEELEDAAAHGLAERPRVPVAALALTVAAWAALLASTAWIVLGIVAAGLAVVTLATRAWRAGREVWGVGAGLALALAIGALGPAIIGAVEWEPAVQRAIRAALLVLSATWVRAAAGTPGMREAARRSLIGIRRVPAAAEAAQITGGLESDRRLVPAARAFVDALEGVPHRPGPLADALVGWVAAEAAGYRPPGRR